MGDCDGLWDGWSVKEKDLTPPVISVESYAYEKCDCH